MVFNHFPNKPWFLRVCHTNLLQTLQEKEKLLITSNFSFSNSVFYHFGELCTIFIKAKIVVCNLFQFRRVQNLSYGKGLTLSQISLGFTCLQYKLFENTMGKGKIAGNEQFFLFPQCFLPFQGTFCHFHQIWNCLRLTLSIWKSLKFVVWERVERLLKVGHVGKKLGDRVKCRKNLFYAIEAVFSVSVCMKVSQKISLTYISGKFEHGHVGLKTRSQGQISQILGVQFRGKRFFGCLSW